MHWIILCVSEIAPLSPTVSRGMVILLHWEHVLHAHTPCRDTFPMYSFPVPFSHFKLLTVLPTIDYFSPSSILPFPGYLEGAPFCLHDDLTKDGLTEDNS